MPDPHRLGGGHGHRPDVRAAGVDPQVGEGRDELADRIGQLERALLVQHHRGHRGDRLGHRVQPPDRVRLHRQAGLDVALAAGRDVAPACRACSRSAASPAAGRRRRTGRSACPAGPAGRDRGRPRPALPQDSVRCPSAPPSCRNLRHVSYSKIPAATARFSDSAVPVIGIRSRRSPAASRSPGRPAPSLPSRMASGAGTLAVPERPPSAARHRSPDVTATVIPLLLGTRPGTPRPTRRRRPGR